MIANLINLSQKGINDATLSLIEKFNPVLKKYAYQLFYEDAYNDLLLDLIELLHNIRLDLILDKSEGSLVSYLATSIRRSYIKRLIELKQAQKFILYTDLSDGELYRVEAVTSTYDNYFTFELLDMKHKLTKSESTVINLIYLSCYTVPEIAGLYGISRQAVNQTKKRALIKLKKYWTSSKEEEF